MGGRALPGGPFLRYEQSIPVNDATRAACELLGFDPLYIANEGKLVAIVDSCDAEKVLDAMKQNLYGADANIIGEIIGEHKGKVVMKNKLGTSRIVDMLSSELLPRIC